MKYNKELGNIYRSPNPPPIMRSPDESLIAWYDNMKVDPLSKYFSLEDLYKLDQIAMSVQLNSNPKEKFKQIREIMKSRGFTFLSGGTNRRVYSCDYDSRVIAKVAINKAGENCNFGDHASQEVLKPFMYKTYEVSFNGVVSICEPVYPIHNLEEFEQIASEVYDILQFKIRMNDIAADDIGSRSFKNWGIRPNFGPVIIDCPVMCVVDPKKCFCNARDQFGRLCNAPLDYDVGFDKIICTQCGKKYIAKALSKTNGSSITELMAATGRLKNCKGEMVMKIAFRNDNNEMVEVDFKGKSSGYVVKPTFQPKPVVRSSSSMKITTTSNIEKVMKEEKKPVVEEEPFVFQVPKEEKKQEDDFETRKKKYLEDHKEEFDSIKSFSDLANFISTHPEYDEFIEKDNEEPKDEIEEENEVEDIDPMSAF